MCQDNNCIVCHSSSEDVADWFIGIFEEVFTTSEEAQLHIELGIGTDPQP